MEIPAYTVGAMSSFKGVVVAAPPPVAADATTQKTAPSSRLGGNTNTRPPPATTETSVKRKSGSPPDAVANAEPHKPVVNVVSAAELQKALERQQQDRFVADTNLQKFVAASEVRFVEMINAPDPRPDVPDEFSRLAILQAWGRFVSAIPSARAQYMVEFTPETTVRRPRVVAAPVVVESPPPPVVVSPEANAKASMQSVDDQF